MTFQLSKYLSRFDSVCTQKFGRTYNFAALEASFREHANGKRHLTAKDIGRLFSPENSPFAKYWSRPPVKALEEVLTKERLYLGPLTEDRSVLVARLLPVFHNIGTVSLILRFIHPDHFGIFSTPVIHLLLVSRPATIELYLAYCDELARWRQHFGLPSVAQTESALWTFAESLKLSVSDGAAVQEVREFDDDMWVQRQRAAQVIRPFFRRYGRLQLARILLDEDPVVAGKIAAEEYERLLAMASWHLHQRALPRGKGVAEAFIEELSCKGIIRPEERIELIRIWKTRNKVIHPAGIRPERAEVEVMIDYIESICSPWEKSGFNSPRGRSRGAVEI